MTVQVHKVILRVMDFDNMGAKGVIEELENVRYPNGCICPEVLSIASHTIEDWTDAHPLNSAKHTNEEFNRLFPNPLRRALTEVVAALEITHRRSADNFKLTHYCVGCGGVTAVDKPIIHDVECAVGDALYVARAYLEGVHDGS